MTEVNEAKIRAEVECRFPILESKSESQLRAEIGALILDIDLLDEERSVSEKELISTGDAVAKRKNVRKIVCDPENHRLIGDALTVKNVSSLVLVIPGIFNVTAVAAGIHTLAVLIVKITLNEYRKVPVMSNSLSMRVA